MAANIKRRSFWKQCIVIGGSRLLNIYAALGFVLFLSLLVFGLVVHRLPVWVAGILLIALVLFVFLEGAYQVFREMTSDREALEIELQAAKATPQLVTNVNENQVYGNRYGIVVNPGDLPEEPPPDL